MTEFKIVTHAVRRIPIVEVYIDNQFVATVVPMGTEGGVRIISKHPKEINRLPMIIEIYIDKTKLIKMKLLSTFLTCLICCFFILGWCILVLLMWDEWYTNHLSTKWLMLASLAALSTAIGLTWFFHKIKI